MTSAAATGASVAVLANVTRHSSADVLLGYVRTVNLVADYPRAIIECSPRIGGGLPIGPPKGNT